MVSLCQLEEDSRPATSGTAVGKLTHSRCDRAMDGTSVTALGQQGIEGQWCVCVGGEVEGYSLL